MTLNALFQRPGGEYEHWGLGVIEGEDYDSDSGLSEPHKEAVDVGGGWSAGKFGNGDHAKYDNVQTGFDSATDPLLLYVRASSDTAGTLKFRTGSSSGPVFATVTVNTADRDTYTTYRKSIPNNVLIGVHDIYVTAETPGMEVFLNWFRSRHEDTAPVGTNPGAA